MLSVVPGPVSEYEKGLICYDDLSYQDGVLQKSMANFAQRWLKVYHPNVQNGAKAWFVWQLYHLSRNWCKNQVFLSFGKKKTPAHNKTGSVDHQRLRFLLMSECWYKNFVIPEIKEPYLHQQQHSNKPWEWPLYQISSYLQPTTDHLPNNEHDADALPSEDDYHEKTPFKADRRMEQRLKQIAYGKSTPGYQNYVRLLPHDKRDPSNPNHPVTPRFYDACSKRSWDACVRKWRRDLHYWDSNAILMRESFSQASASWQPSS